ncbi:ABC transporter permease [Lentibacillus sediminis]|uniref:ABC transporter permease n=1 Tax=Lentibacillus sediminis TaxID=1940529 RepID=UPI000C1C4751|nr:ABC transporter permease [Lentibacillus sediminis]
MYERYFKGTGTLIKLLLRQQRFKIFAWLGGLVIVTLAVASAYPSIYKDEQSKQAFALTMDNPAMVAMLGPLHEIENYIHSIGAVFAHEMLLFTAVAVGIMSILLAGRSTRADEEEGLTEMIHALSVGRLSYLSAAMIVLFLTNVLLAVLTGFGLAVLGIEEMGLEGSLLYGVILGSTGFVFSSFTVLFAQVAETSRGATMLSFAVLILAYLVRAIGDVSNETLSLISPLGWTVRTEVFVENDWWPILLKIAAAIIITILAFYLNTIRDLGSGFIASKGGKKHASAFLKTPFGLSWRLGGTNIIAWAIGVFALGASFGAILGDLETYYAEMDVMQAFIAEDAGSSMTEQFIGLLMAIMALISVIPAVMTVLKLKGEENRNRTENLYSRAVSRGKVLGSYYILAVIVTIVMQALVAIGLWSAGLAVMDEALEFGTIFTSALVYLPAMWVVVGIAVLLVGTLPKATGFVWFYVVYLFIVLYLNGILEFPQWMVSLSVFEHVPTIPTEEMDWATMIILTVIAMIIAVIGFIGYNKRDLEG